MPNTFYTLDNRPELRQQISEIHWQVWPDFMRETDVGNRAWAYCFEVWGKYQVALCDETGTVLAAGNTVPISWDGTIDGLPPGWDEATEAGMIGYERGETPNALSAYAIVVSPEHQGKGYSAEVLGAMAAIAREHGLLGVAACVRPTYKEKYPLTPFDRYVQWKDDRGLPFDPWLRVHWRAGARLERVALESMRIMGTVAQWEEWTKLHFPDSGQYVVQGGLQPITIDREGDVGVYVDPNIWMVHRTK